MRERHRALDTLTGEQPALERDKCERAAAEELRPVVKETVVVIPRLNCKGTAKTHWRF